MEEGVEGLIRRLSEGDLAAREELLPLVYDELHQIAQRSMARQSAAHTLQPTALVNEAYLRLFAGEQQSLSDYRHFLRLASTAMRQVLVDSARHRHAEKRCPSHRRLEIDAIIDGLEQRSGELGEVDRALEALAENHPDLASLVELRFFGGQTVEDAADVLGVSPRQAARMWNVARAFLARELDRARLE